MRTLKKYPNRRLYDTQASRYVTLDDVRHMVLDQESIRVLDSRSGKDLTRSVLLQIIAAQEEEGHQPLLTDRLLTQLVRFYGSSFGGLLGRYLEQSVLLFLEQQERYQRGVRTVMQAPPLRFLRSLADQNVAFWRRFEDAVRRDDENGTGPQGERTGASGEEDPHAFETFFEEVRGTDPLDAEPDPVPPDPTNAADPAHDRAPGHRNGTDRDR